MMDTINGIRVSVRVLSCFAGLSEKLSLNLDFTFERVGLVVWITLENRSVNVVISILLMKEMKRSVVRIVIST